MLKLYEYDEAIGTCLEAAINDDGEILDEKLLEEAEGLQLERTQKLLGMAAIFKNLKAEDKAYDEVIAKLGRKQVTLRNSMASLKRYIDSNLKEGEKLKNMQASMYRSTSKAVVLDVEPEELPGIFQKHTVAADKTAIKKALERTDPLVELNGCAHFETSHPLVIR